MHKPSVTEKSFEMDGKGKLLPHRSIMFVCPASGCPRLSDPDNSEKSGGAASALRAELGDYVLTGFRNNNDVVVQVWRINLIVTSPHGQSAETELVHRLGASGHWKPDLGRRSALTQQIEIYASAIPNMLAPVHRPLYSGRR